MKAITAVEYGGSDVLTVTDRNPPSIENDESEVQINVDAAGVNFADVEQRRGNYPEGPSPPFVPGLEVAGTVTAAPTEASIDVGDRVAALTSSGGYAEIATAPVDRTFRVPKSLSTREAVAIPVQGLTAHNILHEWGRLGSEERVLIHAAAGGVGSLAIQLAATAGAEVFATASTDTKLDIAKELGADHAIKYSETNVAESVSARTDGKGVDLVLDGVGGNAFAESVEALAPNGRIVSFGMASGSIPTVAVPRLFFENQSVIGYHLEHAFEHVPHRVYTAVPDLLDHLHAGRVEPIIGETFALTEARAAHDELTNRETVGKVVLEP
ncbi:NADPH:quinone oxidoreductase family protein [Haloferax sp. ATB1]|uniref:quinone oxidoreductase family protein n=1 Tax=Haloferax sp. ATB1 TaxID=1508454 RepID=UPI0005B22FEB|nr:NADPH:quinone oxidoreductase family protein [Haloferax sp. ATB1]